MYDDIPAPRARLLSLLVAAACGGLCATASADPTITLTATYALNGNAPADAIPEGSTTPLPGGGADFYFSKDEAGSGVFFHTYGDTNGSSYFGARASGQGLDFYARTSALYSGSYTNTTGSVQLLNFSFNVDSGNVGLSGDGTGSANTRLQIRRNGSVVSQGDTTIVQTTSGVTCSESDIGVLGNWANCASATDSSVYGAGGPFTVNMGLVGIGETILIDYDIVSIVSGRGNVHTCGGGYGGYGGYEGYGGYGGDGGNGNPLPTYECADFSAIARSGDPFDGGTPVNTADFLVTATAVDLPEPGSLGLLAAAGGGWWLSRRRRNGGSAG
ncbi:PEP-CTERM sorting domain-containing protein [Pelomonas cellulosilytica]|uniref:PEP-CTERM sorting domain-containing protein n=1 Tax=Pelomonas cellulosilytica TaxID=2906762 RepID=A0ABS8XPK6_9BURK|nr:PEP-CTERM sorting domain-containing protein [Pelomonas sp. P8]MCE4554694.1 PEP-CTERM sorting domain-containing protein [Pelomonas sp. P8]